MVFNLTKKLRIVDFFYFAKMFFLGIIGPQVGQAQAVDTGAPVSFDQVMIQLMTSPEEVSAIGGTIIWDEGCQKLGEALLANPEGSSVGIFKSVKCRLQSKPIRASSTDPWVLSVERNDEGFSFKLSYFQVSDVVAKTKLEMHHVGLDFLLNEKVAHHIALHLLSQTPMLVAMNVPKEEPKDRTNGTGWDKLDPKVAQMLGDFDLFTLTYHLHKRGWVPEPVGTADLRKLGETNSPSTRKLIITANQFFPPPGTVVWARPTANMEALRAETQVILDKSLGSYQKTSPFWEKAVYRELEFAKRGYLSLRYGSSLTSLPFLRDISIFSLLLSSRQEPLDGFTLRYDLWPKVEGTAELGPQYFESDRVIVGWAFDIPLPLTPYFDRMEFIPFLGRWSMKYVYNDRLSSGEMRSSVFDESNSWTIDGELVLEKIFSNWMLRLWAARALGISFLTAKTGQIIKTTRMGSDLILSLRPSLLSEWFSHTQLWVFLQQEDLSISRREKKELNQNNINGFSFSSIYLGGGIGFNL